MSHRFEALTVACRQDNIHAACRLIFKAGDGESAYGQGKSFRPAKRWSREDVSQISSIWHWALNGAVEKVGKRMGIEEQHSWSDDDIWSQVVGEFVAFLIKCGFNFKSPSMNVS